MHQKILKESYGKIGVFRISKFIDITGYKYNHLTVLRRGPDLIKKDGKKQTRWYCSCDCGSDKEVLVLGYNLKNGNTTSCGCEHLKNAMRSGKLTGRINGKRNKKFNSYDLSGEYGVGFTSKNEEFYFDLEDYGKIKNYCWHINNDGYVANKTEEGCTLMHRLVMGLSKGDRREVDHIYHKTNDNRKDQLRIVCSSENKMNQGIPSNNTSGYRGVYYDKQYDRWSAEIVAYNHKFRLGYFTNKADAVKARKQAEEKYFGEYNYRGGDVSYEKP